MQVELYMQFYQIYFLNVQDWTNDLTDIISNKNRYKKRLKGHIADLRNELKSIHIWEKLFYIITLIRDEKPVVFFLKIELSFFVKP